MTALTPVDSFYLVSAQAIGNPGHILSGLLFELISSAWF